MIRDRDFAGFVEAINGIADYYRRERPTGFALRVWWESLEQFDLEAVQRALVAHVNRPDRDGQFMPTVASLRQLLSGSTTDRAALAWSKVATAVRQVGCGVSVVFDDALIHRVLADMGGWIDLGRKTDDDWPFVGREFEQRYRAYAARGERPDYPRSLVGYYEAGNAAQGHHVDPPVLIGDPQAAAAVLAGGESGNALRITHVADVLAQVPQLGAERRAA